MTSKCSFKLGTEMLRARVVALKRLRRKDLQSAEEGDMQCVANEKVP